MVGMGLVVLFATSKPCFSQAPQSSPTQLLKPWSASAERVAKLSEKSNEINYAESKVPSYSLPNALIASDGAAITTPKLWSDVRRPELMELFREQIYGRRPDKSYSVRFEQISENLNALDGAAIGRSMKVVLMIDDRVFSFPFTVLLPKEAIGKAPLVVMINNRYFVPLEKAITEHDPFWPVETIIDRGYATATFFTSDVDPDNAKGYSEGVRSFFAAGAPPDDDAWRSLSAWGWAASRVLDYLKTVQEVDATRAAVVGHSRGGKAALWAASEDERFAIAYSNHSGCGGAALSRRAYGETVRRITTNFPHWFSPNFASYADRERELPVDQHELISLIAPRAVYVTSADEDLWADPKGEYASLVAAAPVFQLLGEPSITDPEMPALNQQRIVGKTGYCIRSGGHGLEQVDWERFLSFADTIVRN
jgi:pimeloyl-ACP methyl ester carboxylesterase